MDAIRKNYQHNDSRNPQRPIDIWFADSLEGLMLFVVFYTKACRWDKCLGCNLSSLSSSQKIDFKSLMEQTDFVYSRTDVAQKLDQIRHIILSNNGSVFDRETFSSTSLIYFVAKTNILVPNLSLLTIETRPEYVDWPTLEFLASAIKEGQTPTSLEVAIGFEAYDEYIRNKVFNKGLDLAKIEDLAQKLSRYDFRLKCYMMQKPVPGMTDKEAVKDIQNAIDYLDWLSGRFGIKINMHLNPTYAAKGTLLGEAFLAGKYEPPHLCDVAEAVKYAKGKKITVYVGLNDEGLAVPGGSFLRESDKDIVETLKKFNATQDFSLLE